MIGLQKIHQKLNLLSLDVVLGAVAGMLFFSNLLNVNPTALEYLIMALAVWGIYTLDHLIDVLSLKGMAQTKRHSFHQKYIKTIFIFWGLMVLLGVGLLFRLESLRYLLLPGAVLVITMVLWMAIIRKVVPKAVWLKEISIALFYVVGIILVPFLKLDWDLIDSTFYFMGLGYVLVAWLNLLILSFLDKESDKIDGFESILSLLSNEQLELLIIGLSVVGGIYFVGLLLWLPSYFHIYSGILLLILLFHAIQFLRAEQPSEVIRKKLELSFLLPFLLLLFN